jgi:protein tyrosine phosphatase
LPRGQQSSWDAATNPQNLMKNRYKQIAAYDYNRVILDGPQSYINASYITVQIIYIKKKELPYNYKILGLP